MGTAALVGALVSPLGGVLGDRVGFRPVLIAALAGAGTALLLMPLDAGGARSSPSSRSAWRVDRHGQRDGLRPAGDRGPGGAAVATLNLVYLPLYAAGIIGPAAGARRRLVSGGATARSSSAVWSSSRGPASCAALRRRPSTGAAATA